MKVTTNNTQGGNVYYYQTYVLLHILADYSDINNIICPSILYQPVCSVYSAIFFSHSYNQVKRSFPWYQVKQADPLERLLIVEKKKKAGVPNPLDLNSRPVQVTFQLCDLRQDTQTL